MLAAFSITPLGSGASVSAAVAEAVRLVRESGLPNETTAMFTTVEGEWAEVMALLEACTNRVAELAPRVSVVITKTSVASETTKLVKPQVTLVARSMSCLASNARLGKLDIRPGHPDALHAKVRSVEDRLGR